MEEIRLRDNAFDIFRYYAAIGVMLLHFTAYASKLSSNIGAGVRILEKVFTFFPGVVVFFTISGFLVAMSYEHSKDCLEFIRKRVVRLYPELWLCTIVNIFVLICFAGKYIDKSFFVWGVTQMFGIANTPSCLSDFATGSVNGALWTIFVNIQLYLVFAVTYQCLKKASKKVWGVLIASFAALNISCGFILGGVYQK